MPKFKCVNKQCLNYFNEVYLPRVTLVLRNGKLVPKKPLRCEWCNGEMQLVRGADFGVPQYNKFPGMSDSEKKRILQKRADDHYNKKGKEEKRERFKNAMKKMKE